MTMTKSITENFSRLKTQEVPHDLFGKIMVKIAAKQRRRALWSFVFSGVVFLVTLGSVVPVVADVHASMTQSGTYQFISLMFSNFSQVASSWQDFLFSLLESLPIFGIAIFLAVMAFLLTSLRFISRDFKILFYRHY